MRSDGRRRRRVSARSTEERARDHRHRRSDKPPEIDPAAQDHDDQQDRGRDERPAKTRGADEAQGAGRLFGRGHAEDHPEEETATRKHGRFVWACKAAWRSGRQFRRLRGAIWLERKRGRRPAPMYRAPTPRGSRATPHRTAETRRAAPTPMIEPVMVWVVETGTPRIGRHEQGDRAAGLGAEPRIGVSRVIFEPIVFTMRQPPSVPRPIAACALIRPRTARRTRCQDTLANRAGPR